MSLEEDWPQLYWALKGTMNVGELIELLQTYPKNMKIITTWESTVNTLEKKLVYKSKHLTEEQYLFIDCDSGCYKDDFADNPKENEPQ